ncbi:MAG: arginine--tRNA ligase [Thermodesulfobacteriota bacterium]
MRHILKQKVLAALEKVAAADPGPGGISANGLTVEVPKQAEHGDWAANAALVAASALKRQPRDLARLIIANIEDSEGYIEKMEVAGPGFINFTLSARWWRHVLGEIVRRGESYGRVNVGRGRRVQVEFVSANPTGPLHVGHGRGAALGDALARVLDAAGYSVEKEYYVNDAGRQMETLGRAVWYRYLELFGRKVDFHKDLYQGEYIKDLAAELMEKEGDRYLEVTDEEAVDAIYPWAAGRILEGIKEDLARFGVAYQVWFSEKSLLQDGQLQAALDDLKARGHLYEEGGALWFRATAFGDDKDRVLTKSTGDHTYFASDIAYHRNKYSRGFDWVINLWGADHHGYVERMKSAVQALGHRRDQLEVLLVQLVNLLRGGEPVAMSTRAGEFVTLREVVDEVGVDAARFSFLLRNSDSPLDFDLELAKTQSKDNPVYYVQYAHARICSVFKTADEAGLGRPGPEEANLNLLVEEDEVFIMKHLASFPHVVEGAATGLEPHRLTHYLTELAKRFHPYYNRCRFVSDDRELSKARLVLARAVRQVVANGLNLLGVTAPERM